MEFVVGGKPGARVHWDLCRRRCKTEAASRVCEYLSYSRYEHQQMAAQAIPPLPPSATGKPGARVHWDLCRRRCKTEAASRVCEYLNSAGHKSKAVFSSRQRAGSRVYPEPPASNAGAFEGCLLYWSGVLIRNGLPNQGLRFRRFED